MPAPRWPAEGVGCLGASAFRRWRPDRLGARCGGRVSQPRAPPVSRASRVVGAVRRRLSRAAKTLWGLPELFPRFDRSMLWELLGHKLREVVAAMWGAVQLLLTLPKW
ncbi:hypothetical protein TREES_T100007937 [Tupaia chinensis]|uniref:Uncharacterized protein n=1 Tax=Tupaia chinensis TaxID=246437 RepID=L9JBP7_TUPCH|nr:hypothetical protein TREES_T100007937 [Tupaia chinensis]